MGNVPEMDGWRGALVPRAPWTASHMPRREVAGQVGQSKQPPDRHGPDVLRPRPPSPQAQPSVYGELRLEDSRRCSRRDVPTAYMVSPEGLASPHGYSEHARGWARGNDGARAHPDGPWTRLDQTSCRRTVLDCFSVLSLRLRPPSAVEPGSWTPRAPPHQLPSRPGHYGPRTGAAQAGGMGEQDAPLD